MDQFTKPLLKAASESIPRGSRANYKPFWSTELEDLQKDVVKTRQDMEVSPTTENVVQHKDAIENFNREKTHQLKRAWTEKTESLNYEKDTTKL